MTFVMTGRNPKSPAMILTTVMVLLVSTAGGCEKELPRYESKEARQREYMNSFIKQVFITSKDVRKREPAAGLWKADEKSVQNFISQKLAEAEKMDELSRKAFKEKSKSISVYLRVAIQQVVMVTFIKDNFMPQQGSSKLISDKTNTRKYNGSFDYRQGTEDKKFDFSMTWQKEKNAEKLLFTDTNGTMEFYREDGDPAALYEAHKLGGGKAGKVVEF